MVSFGCDRKWRARLWKSLPALTRTDRNLSTSHNSFTGWVMALSFPKNSGDVWQLECVAINQLQAGLSVERFWLCLSCHHPRVSFTHNLYSWTPFGSDKALSRRSLWQGNTCVLNVNGCNLQHLTRSRSCREVTLAPQMTGFHLPARCSINTRTKGRFLADGQLCYYLLALCSVPRFKRIVCTKWRKTNRCVPTEAQVASSQPTMLGTNSVQRYYYGHVFKHSSSVSM